VEKKVKMAILYINLTRYQNTEKTDNFLDQFCVNIHNAMQVSELSDVKESLTKIEDLILLDAIESLDGFYAGDTLTRLNREVEELKGAIEKFVGIELLKELCEKIEAFAKDQKK